MYRPLQRGQPFCGPIAPVQNFRHSRLAHWYSSWSLSSAFLIRRRVARSIFIHTFKPSTAVSCRRIRLAGSPQALQRVERCAYTIVYIPIKGERGADNRLLHARFPMIARPRTSRRPVPWLAAPQVHCTSAWSFLQPCRGTEHAAHARTPQPSHSFTAGLSPQ